MRWRIPATGLSTSLLGGLAGGAQEWLAGYGSSARISPSRCSKVVGETPTPP